MSSREKRAGAYNVETPGRLLDAAEALFAERHYETVTLKEIARAAEAHVSQIVYHFVKKDDLIREVVIRRAGLLSRERLAALDACEARVGPGNVALEPLIRAFIDPYFEKLRSADPGWRNYARFIGRSVWDGKIAPMLAEGFDEAAARYLAALRRALPTLSKDDSLRAFQFMLAGIYGSTTSDPRIAGLSGDARLTEDYDGYRAALIPFVAGGIREIAEASATAARTKT